MSYLCFRSLLASSMLVTLPTLVLGFQVNSYTAGDQSTKDVAVGLFGDFVVVWESDEEDGDLQGVFARRYDSAGSPASSPFQVNDQGAHRQKNPAISMAPDGGFVIAWTEFGAIPPDTSGTGVRARRFDSLGVAAGSAFAVNSWTVGLQSFPAIAHDGSGNFTIAWGSDGAQDGDKTGVFAQRYDSLANPLGGEFQVNTYTSEQQSANQAPAIAAAPDGTVTIAWHSQGQDDGVVSTSGGGVYAQRYDAGGGPLGSEFQVNISTAGGQGAHGVDVATDSLGNLVIAWSDNNEGPPFLVPGGNVVARRFSSAGAPLGGEILVNERTIGGQFGPHVALDGAGNFLIAFDGKNRRKPAAMARYFRADGTAVGSEFLLGTQEGGGVASRGIGASPDGHFVAGWLGADESGAGAFARRFETSLPACPATPAASCRTAGKSLLLIKSGGTDQLVWRWGNGAAFDDDDLGNPEAGLTAYSFCVYRDNGGTSLIYEVLVEASGLCSGSPCWKLRRMKSPFIYKDRSGEEADGITKVRLRGGEAGRGKIQFKGRGAFLNVPSLPIGPFSSVTAQLINGNGECWQSQHGAAKIDSGSTFRAD